MNDEIVMKPVSNGETTDSEGISRVLLRFYTVSLRFRYDSTTIHGGNTKDSEG